MLTKPQQEALIQIKTLNNYEPGRWFTQMELFKVTLHTLRALEEKGYLETKECPAMKLRFYQYTGKELE
jgi:hypothetical protein